MTKIVRTLFLTSAAVLAPACADMAKETGSGAAGDLPPAAPRSAAAPTSPASPSAPASPTSPSAPSAPATAAVPATPAAAPAVTVAAAPTVPAATAAAATSAAQAPDFTLPDTSGASHKLSSYRGKIVVLEWVNHGCPFVKKHYGSGNMQELQRLATSKGVVWLSICSSAEGKQGFMTPEKWNAEIAADGTKATAVLLDPSGDVGRLYEAKTTPHMFVIDKEGRIAYRGAIDDKPTADAADVKGARKYVADAIDAVLAGKPVETAETKPYGCSVKYAAPSR